MLHPKQCSATGFKPARQSKPPRRGSTPPCRTTVDNVPPGEMQRERAPQTGMCHVYRQDNPTKQSTTKGINFRQQFHGRMTFNKTQATSAKQSNSQSQAAQTGSTPDSRFDNTECKSVAGRQPNKLQLAATKCTSCFGPRCAYLSQTFADLELSWNPAKEQKLLKLPLVQPCQT